MGNSREVYEGSADRSCAVPDAISPQQRRHVLAWFSAHNELHSVAQPPKEAFAGAVQVLLQHVETQIWELAGFGLPAGGGRGQLQVVQGKAGCVTCCTHARA